MCAMGHRTSHATFPQPRKLYVQQFSRSTNTNSTIATITLCTLSNASSKMPCLVLVQSACTTAAWPFCCWALACCAHIFYGSIVAFLIYVILLKKTDFPFNFMYICSLCCNALKTHSSLRQQIPLQLGGLPAYIICRGSRQLLNQGRGGGGANA